VVRQNISELAVFQKILSLLADQHNSVRRAVLQAIVALSEYRKHLHSQGYIFQANLSAAEVREVIVSPNAMEKIASVLFDVNEDVRQAIPNAVASLAAYSEIFIDLKAFCADAVQMTFAKRFWYPLSFRRSSH
jgi:hypothetical protein